MADLNSETDFVRYFSSQLEIGRFAFINSFWSSSSRKEREENEVRIQNVNLRATLTNRQDHGLGHCHDLSSARAFWTCPKNWHRFSERHCSNPGETSVKITTRVIDARCAHASLSRSKRNGWSQQQREKQRERERERERKPSVGLDWVDLDAL